MRPRIVDSGRQQAVGACRDTRQGEHKGRMRIAHRPTLTKQSYICSLMNS